MKIKGVLFDKDGTLFDFQKTWNAWSAQMIEHFSAGDAGRRNAIADAVGFDLARQAFDLDSIVIAGTNRQVAESVAAVLPDQSVDAVEDFLMHSSLTAEVSEATPLIPFFQHLKDCGLKIGVMTNDTEAGARAHLDTVGALDLLDFVAGFDSGFGAKPAPGPLLAFAKAMGLSQDQVVVAGDSTHALVAGRAAGLHTIGVLTGLAPRSDLAPYADTILPDISHIPAYLGLS